MNRTTCEHFTPIDLPCTKCADKSNTPSLNTMNNSDDRELDFLVADLEVENRLLRARNERLQHEVDRTAQEVARLKVALARIISVSEMAFRDSRPQGTGEVEPSAKVHDDHASY